MPNNSVKKEIIIQDQKLPIRIFEGHDSKPTYINPHFHEDIEIIVLKSGSVITIDSGKKYKMHSGDIHIFNSNSIHSTIAEDLLMYNICLQISWDFIRQFMPEVDKYIFKPQISSKDEHSKQLLNLLISLLQKSQNKDTFSYLECYSILFKIINILFTNFSSTVSKRERLTKTKYYNRINLLTKFIEANYNQVITLDDLSNLTHLNPSYLSRFIKKNFGISFFDYLTKIRLEHSYKLIVETDLPIMSISNTCGFRTYHQFNKEFKIRYHETPSKIRKASNLDFKSPN
ncbi:AraC family transcriptional regulator [Pediococcus pentosaceus]|uniref:AraC family transcriptional regulator n=1 Tax=Pediococcus pentosaceus TaxID=1255 RepID=UPI00132FAE8A|nr:AraC family transcriptional regulator [Pediococcus pentosaceus]KAF0506276.1 helix-turn-helix domain-containing protein [Pediococcus pentosaceus]